MGRKNRNKIKKESDLCKDQQKQEEEEEKLFLAEEKKKNIEQQAIDNRFNIIWETRRLMLKYCDNASIPLCDYLDINIFQEFVEYLEDQS